jgi:hypothetical protein
MVYKSEAQKGVGAKAPRPLTGKAPVHDWEKEARGKKLTRAEGGTGKPPKGFQTFFKGTKGTL